jgi:hypothetical protein
VLKACAILHFQNRLLLAPSRSGLGAKSSSNRLESAYRPSARVGGGEELASTKKGNKVKSVEERITELKERESLYYSKRDGIEKEINRVLGIELQALQLLRVRQLVSDFERYEKAIENVEERVKELRQVVTA